MAGFEQGNLNDEEFIEEVSISVFNTVKIDFQKVNWSEKIVEWNSTN